MSTHAYYLGDATARRGAGCPRGEAQGARSALHGGAATGCARGAGRSLAHAEGSRLPSTYLFMLHSQVLHNSCSSPNPLAVVAVLFLPEVVCRAPSLRPFKVAPAQLYRRRRRRRSFCAAATTFAKSAKTTVQRTTVTRQARGHIPGTALYKTDATESWIRPWGGCVSKCVTAAASSAAPPRPCFSCWCGGGGAQHQPSFLIFSHMHFPQYKEYYFSSCVCAS